MFKKGDLVYVIELWAKYVVLKVKIKKVIKNKDKSHSYLIWRLMSANELGNYWGSEKYNKKQIFATSEDAYNYLNQHLNEYEKQFICSDKIVIEEIPAEKHERKY